MLIYQTLILGELQTNCYLVWNEETKEAAVIDPADDGEQIAELINIKGLNLKYILATHGHFDHVMGALALKLIFKSPFCCSSRDLFLLKRQKETARFFLGREIEVPNFDKIDINLSEVTKFKLGEEDFKIIKTPGHTPGGVCFYNKKHELLFSGDTLFYQGIGRTDLSYASEKDLIVSLKILKRLPEHTTVLPGHGEKCLLGVAF